MFKLTIIAALVAASFSSAQAQIVTSKCGCQSATIELEKWEWQRTDSTEILESPNVDTWVILDFKNQTAKVKGVGLFPMQAVSSAFLPQTTVVYSDVKMTINYDEKGSYVSHSVEQR